MLIARHLSILGTVQGVGYRDSFIEQAQLLGLSGWIRNRHDGSVEVQVQGISEGVQAVVRWARHGPILAKVREVVEREHAVDLALSGFLRLPTA